MPADHYCTYFDHRYAAQGLALIRSVRAQGGGGPVWVLCLSPEAEVIVRQFGLPDVRIVRLGEVEDHFPALAAAKDDRSTIEYYFTLTPHIVRYVFDRAPDAKRVAYLDGDLFFFGPPDTVWAEMGEAPAAIIPHNFHKGAEHLDKYGRYNVGWVSFARSEQGVACLDFWAESCRNWCHDVPDGSGRFADQGYLDRFHEFAPELKVIWHKGCNLGPWNVGGYAITVVDGAVRVDGEPLLFFHFTGFKKGFAGRWFNSHRIYRTGTSRVVRDAIYRPYLAALLAAKRAVAPCLPAAEARPVLTRKRGGGAGLKARLYKLAEGGFRLLDLATGKALREP